MAGFRRGDRPTLAERSAAAGLGTPAPAGPPAGPAPAGSSAATGRTPAHCWVTDAPAWPGRWPGVLLAWRRDPTGGWWGLVTFAIDHGPPGEHAVIQAWLPADHLRPAPSQGGDHPQATPRPR